MLKRIIIQIYICQKVIEIYPLTPPSICISILWLNVGDNVQEGDQGLPRLAGLDPVNNV